MSVTAIRTTMSNTELRQAQYAKAYWDENVCSCFLQTLTTNARKRHQAIRYKNDAHAPQP